MSQAFVYCPKTENWFYIGVNVEWPGLDSLELGKQKITCPKCGEQHEWTADDLVLRSDGAG